MNPNIVEILSNAEREGRIPNSRELLGLPVEDDRLFLVVAVDVGGATLTTKKWARYQLRPEIEGAQGYGCTIPAIGDDEDKASALRFLIDAEPGDTFNGGTRLLVRTSESLEPVLFDPPA